MTFPGRAAQASIDRRSFLREAMAFGAVASVPFCGRASSDRPLKFLFITDQHIESDFVQSHGISRGEPVYTMWKPGNHAALTATYRFISSDPHCRDIDFALFGGDQLNTGYPHLPKDMADELDNFHRCLDSLDLHRLTRGKASDMDFVASPWKLGGKTIVPASPASRVVVLQGNHDYAVDEFFRDCAFTAGNVRFIGFFASYVGLPPPPGARFHSTGKISDDTLAFIEVEMKKAASDPKIRHIVLVSHWAIADRSSDFHCPIIGACKENGMNANRDKLLALCEKYGCDLYINGHEHNGRYPMAKVGCLTDINCGSFTSDPPAPGKESGGAFAIVELGDDKAVFNVYSRAKAEEKEGKVEITAMPMRLFAREIPLKAIR